MRNSYNENEGCENCSNTSENQEVYEDDTNDREEVTNQEIYCWTRVLFHAGRQ
jgi:hypothetical protein